MIAVDPGGKPKLDAEKSASKKTEE